MSGVLYERLRCCDMLPGELPWAIAGRDGRWALRLPIEYGFPGVELLSLEGARPIAGAVYRFESSQDACGVPCRGNGNIEEAALARDDAGDSATGEK